MCGPFVHFCRSGGESSGVAARVLGSDGFHDISSIPSSYVDALNIFLQYKANQLQAELVQSKPTKDVHDATHRETHIRRLAAQRRFADILASQIAAQQASGSSTDHHATGGEAYTITLPKSKYLNDDKAVKRQGPFLFKPAPEELALSAETGPPVEGIASDLVIMPGTGAAALDRAHDVKGKAKEQAASSSGIGVVAIVWKDGRVDVCLEVAKVEGMWVEEVVSCSRMDYTRGALMHSV